MDVLEGKGCSPGIRNMIYMKVDFERKGCENLFKYMDSCF